MKCWGVQSAVRILNFSKHIVWKKQRSEDLRKIYFSSIYEGSNFWWLFDDTLDSPDFVCLSQKFHKEDKSITLHNCSMMSRQSSILKIIRIPLDDDSPTRSLFLLSHFHPLHNKRKTISLLMAEKSRNGKIIEIAHSWIACSLIQVELRFIKRIHMIEKSRQVELLRGGRKTITICETTMKKKELFFALWKSSHFGFFFPPISPLLPASNTSEKNPSTTFSSLYIFFAESLK